MVPLLYEEFTATEYNIKHEMQNLKYYLPTKDINDLCNLQLAAANDDVKEARRLALVCPWTQSEVICYTDFTISKDIFEAIQYTDFTCVNYQMVVVMQTLLISICISPSSNN